MADEKPKLLTDLFKLIDTTRESIKMNSIAKHNNKLLEEKREQDKIELEKLKKEFNNFVTDSRYPIYNKFINNLNDYLLKEMREIIKSDKRDKDLHIARITGCLDMLDMIKLHNTRIEDLLKKK